MNFDVTEEERKPGVHVVRLSGQFDFSNVARARAIINQRIEDGVRLIIVNLDELDYIDSAGLGVLVGTLARSPHPPRLRHHQADPTPRGLRHRG